jgi:urea transport system ATP-binding protein
LVDTIDLTRMNEAEIAQSGIGRKFQKPTVFEAAQRVRKPGTGAEDRQIGVVAVDAVPGWIRPAARPALPRAACTLIRLADSVSRAGGLTVSHGQKQWLEIGMLLAQDPKLLLLDEPVAGHDRRRRLSARLSCFCRSKASHSLMVVEHDMSVYQQHMRNIVTVLCRWCRAGRKAHWHRFRRMSG